MSSTSQQQQDAPSTPPPPASKKNGGGNGGNGEALLSSPPLTPSPVAASISAIPKDHAKGVDPEVRALRWSIHGGGVECGGCMV